ncbi:MAG: hypothetical protein AAFR82_02900 [Pseudomonadota bacterium]
MKLPWSKSETKTAEPLIALAHLPIADWGRTDPAALVRDGYAGNAIVYRCVRMISEFPRSTRGPMRRTYSSIQRVAKVPCHSIRTAPGMI